MHNVQQRSHELTEYLSKTCAAAANFHMRYQILNALTFAKSKVKKIP